MQTQRYGEIHKTCTGTQSTLESTVVVKVKASASVVKVVVVTALPVASKPSGPTREEGKCQATDKRERDYHTFPDSPCVHEQTAR